MISVYLDEIYFRGDFLKIIGLCGGSGVGKGLVGKIFSAFDIPTIDTDKVYHELISARSDCTEAIAACFGDKVLNSDGSISRPQLRNAVFYDNSEENLKKLNSITHKFILAHTNLMISEYKKCKKNAVLVDAPLLFESGFNKKCDIIVAVKAERETRINRIINRDSITRLDAIKRIDSQINDEFLELHADYVIENSDGFVQIFEQVEKIIKNIFKE